MIILERSKGKEILGSAPKDPLPRNKRKGEKNMKSIRKSVLALLLCMGMLLGALPNFVIHAEAATYGSCGTNMTWSLNTATGHLTIKGSGSMVR